MSALRWLAGLLEGVLWTVEHYASEWADRLNGWAARLDGSSE